MIFTTKYLAKGRIVSTMQSQGRGGVFPFPEKCGSLVWMYGRSMAKAEVFTFLKEDEV